jgi:hypothetical protein
VTARLTRPRVDDVRLQLADLVLTKPRDAGRPYPLRSCWVELLDRLSKVDTEHLTGGANDVCRGERRRAGAATCVKDTVSWAQANPGHGLTAKPVPERQRRVVEVVGGGRLGRRRYGLDVGAVCGRLTVSHEPHHARRATLK